MKVIVLTSAVVFLALHGAPAAAQTGSGIEPIHSFDDLPPLAKDVEEVRKRYGKVSGLNPDSPTNGDTKLEPVNGRVRGWMMSMATQAVSGAGAAGGAGGPMSRDAQQMITELATNSRTLQMSSMQVTQAYHAAQQAAENAYQADINAVEGEYGKKYSDCLNREERAGGGPNCDPVRKEEDDKILKAGTKYLGSLAGPFTDLTTKMKDITAQCQTLTSKADKAFGGSPPAYVRGMYQMAVTTGITSLMSVVGAEDAAVVLVHDRSIASTLHGK
jgi:hypothetical protein